VSTLHVGSLTDTGREREENQDRLLVSNLADDSCVLVVCDGMGGHEDGAAASATASERIFQELNARQDEPTSEAIEQALHAGHDAVIRTAEERGGSNMGTTAVVAKVRGDRLWYGWVGDSRLYVFRDGEVLFRTTDHTLVAEEVQQGNMTEDEARLHPSAGVLTQALSGDIDDIEPSVCEEPLGLQPGDVVLLCSDGLYDLVEDDALMGLMVGRSPADACKVLVDVANEGGGPDNISVVVASFGAPLVGRPRSAARRTLPETPTAPGRALPTLAAVLLALVLGIAIGQLDWVPSLPGPAPEPRGVDPEVPEPAPEAAAPRTALPQGPLLVVTPGPYEAGQPIVVRSRPGIADVDEVDIVVEQDGEERARVEAKPAGAGASSPTGRLADEVFEAAVQAPTGSFTIRAEWLAHGSEPMELTTVGCQEKVEFHPAPHRHEAGTPLPLGARIADKGKPVRADEALIWRIADARQVHEIEGSVDDRPTWTPPAGLAGQQVTIQVAGQIDGQPVCAGAPSAFPVVAASAGTEP